MRLPHKTLEKSLFAKGYRRVIAVDEVGMGSLAGPVVVCAVSFDKKFFRKKHKNLSWLRDSKLLAPHQRENFVRELLKEKNLKYQTSYCFPKTIDRVNIYQAARLAMRRAIRRLHNANMRMYATAIPRRAASGSAEPSMSNDTNKKTVVLVDGKYKIKGLNLEQMAIIKGDRKVFSIACASLLAKVFRDRMMKRYSKRFPKYGFERHKGYGTKLHRGMLLKHGRSPIHRNSFRLI